MPPLSWELHVVLKGRSLPIPTYHTNNNNVGWSSSSYGVWCPYHTILPTLIRDETTPTIGNETRTKLFTLLGWGRQSLHWSLSFVHEPSCLSVIDSMLLQWIIATRSIDRIFHESCSACTPYHIFTYTHIQMYTPTTTQLIQKSRSTLQCYLHFAYCSITLKIWSCQHSDQSCQYFFYPLYKQM